MHVSSNLYILVENLKVENLKVEIFLKGDGTQNTAD